MESEYIYYFVFACMALFVVTKKGRSILANAYWTIDKKYFDSKALSKDETLSKSKRRKHKTIAWIIMTAVSLPIIIIFVSTAYLRLNSKSII